MQGVGTTTNMGITEPTESWSASQLLQNLVCAHEVFGFAEWLRASRPLKPQSREQVASMGVEYLVCFDRRVND
jgi:hypothetical protein